MENWYRIQAALLAAIICTALAVNVLLRARRHLPFRRFAWLNMNLVAWFVTDAVVVTDAANEVVAFAARGIIAALVPTTLVGFFAAFVSDEDRSSRWATGLAATASALLLLAVVVVWLGADLFGDDAAWARAARMLAWANFGAIAGAVILSVTLMYNRFRTVELRAERARLAYLTFASAAVLSLALAAYAADLAVAVFGNMVPAVYMYFMFQVLTLRRILDLFEFLGRFVVLAGFALVLSIIYAVLVAWWRHDFALFLFNTVIATIVILILLDPLRTFVEEKLNELIFREKFEFTKQAEAIRKSLTNVIDVGAMAELMLSRLEASRQITHAAVFVRDEEGLAFDRLGFVGSAPPPSLDAIVARPLLTRLAAQKVLLIEGLEAEQAELRERGAVEDQAQVEILEAVVKSMTELEAALLVAFESDGQLLGFLGVKDERLREAYSADQIKSLAALAAQATITIENSRLFDRIRERDRLAAVGEMAAGLAHEIRNPLGSIKGAAQLLTEVDDDQRATFLDIITDEVNRLDGVVSQFLTYARPLKGKGDLIDVNEVLRRTLTLLSVSEHSSEVELVAAPNLPNIRSDPELLRQITLNLSRNAIEAMEPQGGGRLVISTALSWRTPEAAARAGASGDQVAFVRIRFEDDGPGMPPEVMERLFIPFYTTKTQGTGLGLAICQRIVKSLGGTIEVSSRVGRTTFAVYLPVSEASARTTTVS